MNESEEAEAARTYVGIDWGREEHAVIATNESGRVLLDMGVSHDGKSLDALVTRLVELAGSMDRCHVAIETTHGPVVDTLLERGAHVYAINPKQLDRFRDRHNVAGAKDDRRDAFVLAISLRTDTHLFRSLRGESPHVKQLRTLSRLHEELTEEVGRLASRIAEQLWRYFPAMIVVAKGDLDRAWIHALWKLIPTPERAHKVHPSVVQRLLRKHRISRIDEAEIMNELRAPPLHVMPGTVESAVRYLDSLFERMAVVRKELARCDADIDATFEALPGDPEAPPGQKSEQRDARIVRSLPGVGPILHAALLAEASEPLERRDYDNLRALCGVAPVTLKTGTKTRNGQRVDGRKVVLMRRACSVRLRNAMFMAARVASRHEPVSKAKYAALRARGMGDSQALRVVADRLLKVICAMLEAGTEYDRTRRTPRGVPQGQKLS